MAVSLSAKKSTKFVELIFVLRTGHRVVGEYHVSITTSSAMRPSDVLNESGPFIKLVNARITHENGLDHHVPFLQLVRDSILWVELPPLPDSWKKGIEYEPPGAKAITA